MTPGRSLPSCFEFVFRFQVGSARVSPVAIMIETNGGALFRLASSFIGESPQRSPSRGRIGTGPNSGSSHPMGSVYVRSHQYWHIDVSYINLCGTFHYLCSILDGFSRFLVHWDLRS